MTEQDKLKMQAAQRAVTLVESGMTLGLGTGSTARFFVAELGARLAAGDLTDVVAVPTSQATATQAEELGIPVVELAEGGVDLAVDGMDEYDDALNAIKGLGGALLREKVVAAAAKRFVLIGDESKHVAQLGDKVALPVEVIGFGWRRTRLLLEELGAVATLRLVDGRPFVSDNGNLILDCRFPGGLQPQATADALSRVTGVVEHGLFLGMARRAFVATSSGTLDLVVGDAA